ncbi:MAG TPA: cytochrome c, partial [Rubricoccaceae bacterium]|nr:cytochrome c [Rubricoccaceae bacterium]
IVAEPQEQFEAWYRAQLQPARTPATPRQRRGQEVFLGSTCVMCHTIQGTPARGRVGPDLTHVASRPRLAAGVLPNTRGHLAGWITDPSGVKPGVRMPPNPFPPADLHALLDYLASLE